MGKNILVSIIIPVYNTQRYIKKCLNSVINQSLLDIEIIIVNDGSTDNSFKICEGFADRDKRIVLINKLNEGLEKARVTGVEKAKGLYIFHLDSDDWLHKEGLKKLYYKALKSNADICVGNFVRVMDKYGIIRRKNLIFFVHKNKFISNLEFMDKYYKAFFGINIFPVTMWGKLYKREFLKKQKIELLNLNMGEDLNYNIQIFPEANGIFFLDDVVSYYRWGGMTTKFNTELINAGLKLFNLKKKMIAKHNFQNIEKYTYIELKNFLRSYIEMLIIYKPFQKQQIFENFLNLIKNKNYSEIINFYNKNPSNEDFVQALINTDVNELYVIIDKKVRKEKYKRKIKKIVSSILN